MWRPVPAGKTLDIPAALHKKRGCLQAAGRCDAPSGGSNHRRAAPLRSQAVFPVLAQRRWNPPEVVVLLRGVGEGGPHLVWRRDVLMDRHLLPLFLPSPAAANRCGLFIITKLARRRCSRVRRSSFFLITKFVLKSNWNEGIGFFFCFVLVYFGFL